MTKIPMTIMTKATAPIILPAGSKNNALMYLGEFAKLIRKTLDNSSQAFITLAEEISYLKSYTSLENMRFNNKVQVSFDYKNVPIQEVDIPPMLIQPFVENAFVHAFSKEHNKYPLVPLSNEFGYMEPTIK